MQACADKMHSNISQEPGKMTPTFHKKCTPTFHKSLCVQKFRGKMPRPKTVAQTLCEPAQSKCTSTFHKSLCVQKFRGKMPRPKTVAQTLCEPAQSKCTSTFHKSHCIRKITGKMPAPSWSILIKHQPLLLPKNPSVWTHCFGNPFLYIHPLL